MRGATKQIFTSSLLAEAPTVAGCRPGTFRTRALLLPPLLLLPPPPLLQIGRAHV